MNELSNIKNTIRQDIAGKIESGVQIGGEILPKNPIRVEIVGKSISALQARIIYRDMAPYYFNVAAT